MRPAVLPPVPPTRVEAHFGDRLVRCFAERPAHLNELLTLALQSRDEAPAIIAGAQRISYAELDARSRRVAAGLAEGGIQAGERIALYTGNCPEFVVAALAGLDAALGQPGGDAAAARISTTC